MRELQPRENPEKQEGPEKQLKMRSLFDRRDVVKAGVAIPIGLITFAVASYLDLTPNDQYAANLGITVGAALFTIGLGLASSERNLREAQRLLARGDDATAFTLVTVAKRFTGLMLAGAIVGGGFSPDGAKGTGTTVGALFGFVLGVVDAFRLPGREEVD